MKKTLILALGFVFILSGCIELEEKISIRKDGSGYYETKQVLSKELTSMMKMGEKGVTTKSDQPMSQEELERAFRGNGVKIKSSSFDVVDGRMISKYLIEFRSVTEFFNIPSMRKKYRFYRQGKNLVLMTVPDSNMNPGAKLFPPPQQSISSSESMVVPKMSKGPDVNKEMEAMLMESMKKFLHGLKVAIVVELPNKILESNATDAKGRIARWDIDEKMFTDTKKMKSFGDHIWVKCSLKGLGFSPPKEEDILPVSDPKAKKRAFPSSTSSGSMAKGKTQESPSGSPKYPSPNILKSGGKSTIILTNGNYIQVDGYYQEGDMLTCMKYGGTFSLPISIIQEVKKQEF